jgi:hypothetical protein
MLSLRELQTRFAGSLQDTALAADGPDGGMAVYRNTVRANYRNALGASYPVVRQLVGVPFFGAAVDACVLAIPSTCGDLNVYGDRFGDFLAGYPYASEYAYLPDVARLEWAVDEASRAADVAGTPEAVLAALAAVPAARVTAQRLALDPSCRLLASDHPVFRIWQVHQAGFDGDADVRFGEGTDRLIVRRERGVVVIERLSPGDFAFLRALRDGDDLAGALDRAMAADAAFDLSIALRAHIASRAIAQLRIE